MRPCERVQLRGHGFGSPLHIGFPAACWALCWASTQARAVYARMIGSGASRLEVRRAERRAQASTSAGNGFFFLFPCFLALAGKMKIPDRNRGRIPGNDHRTGALNPFIYTSTRDNERPSQRGCRAGRNLLSYRLADHQKMKIASKTGRAHPGFKAKSESEFPKIFYNGYGCFSLG